MMSSVNLEINGDNVSAARIVIYGVVPIPWRSAAAEQAITGKPVTFATAAAAGEAAVEAACHFRLTATRCHLTRSVVKRASWRLSGTDTGSRFDQRENEHDKQRSDRASDRRSRLRSVSAPPK